MLWLALAHARRNSSMTTVMGVHGATWEQSQTHEKTRGYVHDACLQGELVTFGTILPDTAEQYSTVRRSQQVRR